MTAQKQENEINGEKGLDNPIFKVRQIVDKARKIDGQLVSAQMELGVILVNLNFKSEQLFDLAYRLAISGQPQEIVNQILEVVEEMERMKRNALVEVTQIEQTRKLNYISENDI
jgi:hypothetical protein